MKTPLRFFAAALLALALTVPAIAGDMDAPPVAPPDPSRSAAVFADPAGPSLLDLLETALVVIDLLP